MFKAVGSRRTGGRMCHMVSPVAPKASSRTTSVGRGAANESIYKSNWSCYKVGLDAALA
jgi:hypothetical protein